MFKKLLPHLAALPFALLAGLLTLFLCLWTQLGDWIRQNDSTGYVALVTLITPAVMLMVVTSRFLSFFPKTEGRRLFYSLLIGLVWPALVIAGVFFPEFGRIARDEVRLLVLIFLPVLVISYVVVEVLARRFTSFAYTVLALFYLGIPLFYLVENYRGNRAWENAQADLKAKGEILDYKLLIPQPVPDEDNILKAPVVEEWFVKDSSNSLPWKNWTSLPSTANAASTQPVMGTIRILVSPQAAPADLKTRLGDLLKDASQRAGWSFPALSSQNYSVQLSSEPKKSFRSVNYLSAQPLASLPPLRLELKTDRAPTMEELNAVLPLVRNLPLSFKAKNTAEPGTFDLILVSSEVVSAADFLTLTDRHQSSFDLILQASTRKAAYLEGNYQLPHEAPIPRFNPIRSISMALSDRLKAHVLLGDSQQVLKDIALLHATRRTIASPDFMIVSAMIDTVVANIEYDGIRQAVNLHQFNEEQLSSLQARVEKDNLTSNLLGAMRTERSMFIHIVERHFTKDWFGDDTRTNLMVQFIYWGPDGWRKRNMATFGGLLQMPIEALQGLGSINLPAADDKSLKEFERQFESANPSNTIALMSAPAYSRVTKETARAQTQVHLATVALALERHRLDTGAYPEKLDSLVPKYLAKIPHQVVSADPMLYRKEADGGCVIWSVGWDLKNDNGNPGPSPKLDENSPDWAWKLPAPKP